MTCDTKLQWTKLQYVIIYLFFKTDDDMVTAIYSAQYSI